VITIHCDRCHDSIISPDGREGPHYKFALTPWNDEAKQPKIAFDICGYCASVLSEVSQTKGLPR
jgi:hypothetical protein